MEGLLRVNGIDIWKEYGAFLTEEKQGGLDNQTAILSPSKVKSHVSVNIREEHGCRYSKTLVVANEERDVTLHFALYADTKSDWLLKYRSFINFLKSGDNGWLSFHFTELGLTLKMYYVESTSFKPLTYLWKEGKQASSFKVKFREPNPII